MIVFDNHMHLRRDGRYIDAVKDFKAAGGTHFVLCQYPMTKRVIKDKSYKQAYEITMELANEIRKKTEVGVFVTVGPYPVDYIKFLDVFTRKEAISLMKKGIDEAVELCQEKKIIGIGEVGRPHFQVSEDIINDSNEILLYAMKRAKEVDVAVVLHTESTTPETCKEFVEMGKKVGLLPEKIVKHYSPALILESENFGLMPSVLASKKNIKNAIQKGTRFMMETDYIDDLKRPGAVLGPKTVPKRTYELLNSGLLTEEELTKIHKINPEKTYDICL